MATAAFADELFWRGALPDGAAASYGRRGSTCSITVCDAASVRRVMNGDPMPFHSSTTDMVARIVFSHIDASGKEGFFSYVMSPKNTR